MKVQTHGDHLELTDALKEYAARKIGRLEKYFECPPETTAYVKLSVEHEQHRVEVTLTVHGVLFRAEVRSDDMYSSIDLVSDKLHSQIQKQKTKLNHRFQNRALNTRIKHDLTKTSESSASIVEHEPVVVRTKRFVVKPMSEEEAVLQMELLGHDFFVFTDSSTDVLHVLYRRRDGNYGLIAPM